MPSGQRLTQQSGQNNPCGRADIELNITDTGFILIQDLDLGNTSATNDMHNIVKSIVQYGHNPYTMKVVYKDSSGIYDAVLIESDNTLLGIASLGAGTPTEAYRLYDLRIKDQCLIQHTAFNPC